jgi:hypothetical protein
MTVALPSLTLSAFSVVVFMAVFWMRHGHAIWSAL